MTNNGIRGPEAAAERDGHPSQRLALLIGMLVAFSTMLGSVGCEHSRESPWMRRSCRRQLARRTVGEMTLEADWTSGTLDQRVRGRHRPSPHDDD